MSAPKELTFSGNHQLSIRWQSFLDYFFISKATLAVCPAVTAADLSCCPRISGQACILSLPGGPFVIFAVPLWSVTPKEGFGIAAIQPSIQLCTSQVILMISGFSNFSIMSFLNLGWALLM